MASSIRDFLFKGIFLRGLSLARIITGLIKVFL